MSGVIVKRGEEHLTIKARLVVAADGRYSRLRKEAGIDLEVDEHDFDVLWFDLPRPPGAEATFQVFLTPRRNFLLLPKYPDLYQCGMFGEPGALAHYRTQGLEALRADLLEGPVVHPSVRARADGLLPVRAARCPDRPRAHVVPGRVPDDRRRGAHLLARRRGRRRGRGRDGDRRGGGDPQGDPVRARSARRPRGGRTPPEARGPHDPRPAAPVRRDLRGDDRMDAADPPAGRPPSRAPRSAPGLLPPPRRPPGASSGPAGLAAAVMVPGDIAGDERAARSAGRGRQRARSVRWGGALALLRKVG